MPVDFKPRQTLFGRYAVAEPPRFDLWHRPMPASSLHTVTHTIPIPVLDQEDLLAQGIDTSKLIPGAAQVDALGSCTAQATTASYAQCNGKGFLTNATATDYEKWAIQFYHTCTMQTGDSSQEFPPNDPGSTGLYCCSELELMKLIKNYVTGSNVTQLLSMLQTSSVIEGTPFFNSWMNADQDGFIDGDGSTRSTEEAIDSGVAGGHETCVYAIEQLDTQAPLGVGTVLRVRNSWSDSWGLAGDFRLHASTLDYLCRLSDQCDFKSFVLP